jgi:hypothetical protein
MDARKTSLPRPSSIPPAAACFPVTTQATAFTLFHLRVCLKIGARTFNPPVENGQCWEIRRFWHHESDESFESLIFKTASKKQFGESGSWIRWIRWIRGASTLTHLGQKSRVNQAD